MQSTNHECELGLTTLRPEGIVQTGCMQLAAARVGHMQLRLAQWQRTSTKTYCSEHGYQQRRCGLLQVERVQKYGKEKKG
jgi:hypothetical protein